MIICNYTGANYKSCLDLTLPTWKADKVIVYSDSDEFGIKMFEPTEDFDESCKRKILAIQRTIKENMGQNILWLDADCAMGDSIDEVFENPADVIATRMVRRDRDMPTVNAGVSFWKANDKTLQFCEKWLKIETEYRNEGGYCPEQTAFNQLVYEGYDGLAPWTASNVSENIYNFERDDTKQFAQGLKEYNPKIIHLKQKRWQDPFSLDLLKQRGII
jgi:hypothetical protein